MTSLHTTAPLEAIGGIVRTRMTVDGGGFLVGEFRDSGGTQHTEEAKANARLFVAAAALHELAEQVLALADINTPPALIAMAGEALHFCAPAEALSPGGWPRDEHAAKALFGETAWHCRACQAWHGRKQR